MIRRVALLVASALLVCGCGPTMGDLPLPGNGVAGETTTITVRFDDVLNLTEGAAVKVNGIAAGKVRSVAVDDFAAVVELEVQDSAQVRRTATARLRYTTPLGELFVDVDNPDRGPVLGEGEQLDPARASTAPTVEDTLASASLLINGGGLAQLQTVTDELNAALGGREDRVRRLLARGNEFLRSANATSADFLAALDSLARVSRVLQRNEETINAALRDIRPAARVLQQNTPAFTRLLAKVDRFAATANRVVGATRDDLLQMVEQVSPILDEFLRNRDVLEESLVGLVRAGRALDNAVPGDYANLLLGLQLEDLEMPGIGQPVPSAGAPSGGGSPAGAPGDPVQDLLDGLAGDGSLGGLLGGAR